MMKKVFFSMLAASFLFFGCDKFILKNDVFKIGATPVPHAEMLELVKDDLEQQGYKIQIVKMVDYDDLNNALEHGEIQANFYQHIPYLEETNKEKNYHLASVGAVHIEPMGLYSKKISSLSELKKGSCIALSTDITNRARSLLLLQSAGLIKLKRNDIDVTFVDITENRLNLAFREVDSIALTKAILEADAAVINGNIAMAAGLSATDDALFLEGKESLYVNVVAVKKGMEENPCVKAIVSSLQSEKIADYIEKAYPHGEVVKAF